MAALTNTVVRLDDSMSPVDMAMTIQRNLSTEELRDLIDELCDLYEPTDEMLEAPNARRAYPRNMK